ncbi:MAG: ATP-binding protein [Coriobacteriia bacterium]|nr:ATP-binding protein [Coriobacteriia bacterium]
MYADRMLFLNRTDEIATLESRWSSGTAELLIIWGRRRVGKTELLARFVKDRRGLLFEATAGTTADHLRDFSRVLGEAAGRPLLSEQVLSSWSAALAAVEEYATERTVIALDEFQYLVQADSELPSLLARWWRERGRHLPLVLVLSGSEVSFFERDILGHSSPLYGRRTGQMQLAPFTYRDAALFVPGWSAVDRIRAYAVWGGMPYYLDRIDPDRSLAENILSTVLARDGILREEARLLLFQELAEPRLHFSVLRSLAGGDTRVSEIANRTGADTVTVSRVLDTLLSLMLVRRIVPVTATLRGRTKRTSWEISDPYLRFWFRFVLPFEERLQRSEDQVRHLEDAIMPKLDEFVARPIFENIAQEYARQRFDVADVGTWWGKVPTGQGRTTETREVDVVGIRPDGSVALLGSCKWSDAPMGVAEDALLSRLEPHVGEVLSTEPPVRVFFSRSGFDGALTRLAATDPERYVLVTAADLYEDPALLLESL